MTDGQPATVPNPNRVAAGRRNRALRGPLTEAGRERLRQAALQGRPWEYATGPRSAAGKARSARNGASRQSGPASVRAIRAELAALWAAVLDNRRAIEASAWRAGR